MRVTCKKKYSLIFALIFCVTGLPHASQSLRDDSAHRDIRFLNQLALVHDSNAAQQKIRFYVKGYREKMVDLFTKTINPQIKIYIANAYTIHEWACDHHKNFYTISSPNLLESYAIACKARNCLRYILMAMRPPLSPDHLNFLTHQIYDEVMALDTVFSLLLKTLHFKVGPVGFLQAARLRPYIDLCHPEITFYYGQSLFRSSPGGSALFNEGLYYMYHSGLLQHLDLRHNQKHDSMAENYRYLVEMPVQSQPCTGIKFSIVNVYAQPTQFIRLLKLLTNSCQLSPFDVFDCCNEAFLRWIFKKLKSKRLSGSCEVEGNIYKFKQYKKSKRSRRVYHNGTVSIDISTYQNNRFKLYESFQSNNYINQIMISFYEDFLTRSGSPQSLVNLLETATVFKIRRTELS